jgi:hypothetical protein
VEKIPSLRIASQRFGRDDNELKSQQPHTCLEIHHSCPYNPFHIIKNSGRKIMSIPREMISDFFHCAVHPVRSFRQLSLQMTRSGIFRIEKDMDELSGMPPECLQETLNQLLEEDKRLSRKLGVPTYGEHMTRMP